MLKIIYVTIGLNSAYLYSKKRKKIEMNIFNKIEHVSNALEDQKVLNDLGDSLNLEKNFIIKFSEKFGLVKIAVGQIIDSFETDSKVKIVEDLESYKVDKVYVFTVSLDDKDLSMQEVYVETTDDILTDKELMKFMRAIVTIKSALK